MDKSKTTPKDFFLWAGAMLALYVSVFSFLGLMFDYVNYAFPDPLVYLPADPYQGSISYEMASLIVLLPLFLVLMWLIHRDIAKDSARREVWVRRWALVLTIFVTGVTIAVDLVVLLMNFFNGGLTTPFLLKILIVFLVAAAGCMHFLADLRDYWQKNPALLHRVGWGVGLLAMLTILAGFVVVGTPWQARLYRFDEQKISDLQNIQTEILYYWQQSGTLPTSLAMLNDPISNYMVPSDPQTGKPYGYTKLDAHSFNLCAAFNADSHGLPELSSPMIPAIPGQPYSAVDDNWQHGAGQVCYLRSIDPALYAPNAPIKKTQ